MLASSRASSLPFGNTNMCLLFQVKHPETIKDLRKISCTSDYSKIFEAYLKDWIIQDIWKNNDPSQYCGEKGTGTEHMIVMLLDRIQQLLDNNPDRSAVLAVGIDWAGAFDKSDPTKATTQFIKLGLRPSLTTVLIDYLSNKKVMSDLSRRPQMHTT